MPTRLLIADPNAGFAMMVKQVLEDTGEYRVAVVNTGAEAVQAAAGGEFDLAIVDMDLPDMPAAEVIPGIRAAKPRLAVMIIPLDGDDSLPALARLDIQGTLTKPFFIPDLPGMIDKALSRPVGGAPPEPRVKPSPPIVPPGDKPTTAHAPRPSPRERPVVKSTPPRASHVPPPPWLLDVNRAAQYLTRLSLETAAEAALITHDNRLWAYAGHFVSQQVEELARIVVESWASDGGSGSVARFVKLSEGKQHYMLYSMPVAADFVLSLAFQAETPIGMIRKQARKLADTLVQRPPADPPPPPAPPVEAIAPPPAEDARTDSDSRAESVAPAAAQPLEAVPAVDVDPTGSVPDEPEELPEFLEEAEEAPPVFVAPPTGGLGDWQKSPLDAEVEPEAPAPNDGPTGGSTHAPHPAPAGAAIGFEHAPGALYHLTYSFVMVPKLPRYRIVGDLAARVDELLRHYAVVYHWRIERLTLRPNHAVVVVTCPPTTAPERVMRTLRRLTSQRIAEEFPRAMPDDPTGDFWARPYLLFAADHTPDPAQIADFITQVRRQQGLIG